MKMFNLIGYGERAGSGVPDIYAVWKEAGYVEPTVEEQFGNGQPNRTIVHLPLVQKEHPAVHHPGDEKGDEKGDENRKQAVIELMRGNSKISITDISKETGLTKRQVEKTIISLKEEGSIHREGPAKGGHWVIDR